MSDHLFSILINGKQLEVPDDVTAREAANLAMFLAAWIPIRSYTKPEHLWSEVERLGLARLFI